MAGILIYQDIKLNHSSFVSSDDQAYEYVKRELLSHGYNFVYEKIKTSLDKIEKAQKEINGLVARLNIGENVNLEKELDFFFR